MGKVVGREERKRFVDILLEDELSMGDGIEIVNEELPGNIVTMMQNNRQRIDHGKKGEILTIGYIDGTVKKGDLVYKISDKALNKRTQETFAGKFFKKVPITAHLKAVKDEKLSFSVSDQDGHELTATSDYIPETAINRALSEEAAMAQIAKTGATPFSIADCTFEIGENLSVPLSEINLIRRRAMDDLLEMRKEKYPERKITEIKLAENNLKNQALPKMNLYFYQWLEPKAFESIVADRIYVPFLNLFEKDHLEIIKKLKENGAEVFAAIPPVTKGEEDELLKKQAKDLQTVGIDGVLLGNISHLEFFADSGLPMVGDYSFNIYNSQSIKAAADLGLKGVALSHELTISEIKMLSNCGIELEATVYGSIPVMVSEHCAIGSELSDKPDSLKCGLCENGCYALKDRMGAEFPLLGDPKSCRSTLLHFEKLYVPEYMADLKDAGVTNFRLYVSDEKTQELKDLLVFFRRALGGEKNDHVRQKGYTKGHYNRGV